MSGRNFVLFSLTIAAGIVKVASTSCAASSSSESLDVDLAEATLLQRGHVDVERQGTEVDNQALAIPCSKVKTQKVIHIRLYKVGSSTLSSILWRRCDNYGFRCAGIPHYGDNNASMRTSWGVMPDELRAYAKAFPGAFDIWHHHVFLEPESLDILAPGSIKVALFRDPLSRVLSGFRHRAWTDGAGTMLHIISEMLQNRFPLEQLCGSNDWLRKDPSKCCGPWHIGTAMSAQVPLEQFHAIDFVMLTEEYDKSMLMYRRFAGFELADMLYLRLNVKSTSMPPEVAEANAEITAYFTSGNVTTTEVGRKFYNSCVLGDEAKLYNMAKQKFRQQWAAFSASEQEDLEMELVVFREALSELATCCSERPADVHCMELSELSSDWDERHGKSRARPESLPYPLLPGLTQPPQAMTANLSYSLCKGRALRVLRSSSAWQM